MPGLPPIIAGDGVFVANHAVEKRLCAHASCCVGAAIAAVGAIDAIPKNEDALLHREAAWTGSRWVVRGAQMEHISSIMAHALGRKPE
jgi:hypothetical protein